MDQHIFGNYISLIVFCLIVILSHAYDSLAKKVKVPAVIILLATGFILRIAAERFGLNIDLEKYITFFGVIGLIMIVLEGTIDIKLTPQNRSIILKGFFAALMTLLFSVAVIGYLFYILTQRDFRAIFINAIPLAVVSSAIAIPTARHLRENKKEFITYESTFSDILGIMLFNLALQQKWTAKHIVTFSLVNSLGVIFISLFCAFGLLLLVKRIKAPAKFSFILAIMILIYALGKLLHISVLFLVFLFGILLNNPDFYVHRKFLKMLRLHGIDEEMEQFKPVINEGTFLVRTFFFILFGFTICPEALFKENAIGIGAIIVLIIVLIRYIYFRILHKKNIVPELLIAPRGLVTVLLFYSIPPELRLDCLTQGVVLFVILATNLVMMAGVLGSKKNLPPDM